MKKNSLTAKLWFVHPFNLIPLCEWQKGFGYARFYLSFLFLELIVYYRKKIDDDMPF